MKEILLTQGKVALVDDEDFIWLNTWKWFAIKSRRSWYAIRHSYKPKQHKIWMHREIGVICGAPRPDHVNGDGLDNQRHNLRDSTRSENSQNQRKRLNKTRSRFKGVSWVVHTGGKTRRSPWRAQIDKSGQPRNYLGYHQTEEAAARAYDAEARRLFGVFACLNFPKAGEVSCLPV